MKKADLPSITKQQKQILFYLYKFRYITVQQFKQLFRHNSPFRIQEWLNNLRSKKYIERIKDSKDVTKPIIYCLNQQARHILKEDETVSVNFLKWLYKEKDNEEKFINHLSFILNSYLYFLRNIDKKSELTFFNEHELKEYDYFPKYKPDAYIAVKDKEGINRYFLESFDGNDPDWLPEYKLGKYIKYFQEGDWLANTENTPLPSILFILPTEKKKKHIFMYGKAVLEKSFEEISLFVTTKDNIRFAKKDQNIWQKVEAIND